MTKVQYNVRAFEQIRREPGVKAKLAEEADAIAGRCGEGYVAVSSEGRTRSRAAVITANGEAIRDNSENQTLLRALGGQ